MRLCEGSIRRLQRLWMHEQVEYDPMHCPASLCRQLLALVEWTISLTYHSQSAGRVRPARASERAQAGGEPARGGHSIAAHGEPGG